ncbi:MAG: hypothetical protein JST54_08955 [Deltaproteobacteria bacterium]|nr:hypothetical protein [Deltaproteobacteria bacterium]
MRVALRASIAIVAMLAMGCLTHLPPPRSHCQLKVHWTHDFDAAQARAQAEDKPILAVLAAGQLDGPC